MTMQKLLKFISLSFLTLTACASKPGLTENTPPNPPAEALISPGEIDPTAQSTQAKPAPAVSLCPDGLTVSNIINTNTQNPLGRAFWPCRSQGAGFAKNQDDRSYYVRLRTRALWVPGSEEACSDKSFMSWVRKFFYTDASASTITMKIDLPQAQTPRTYPLFAHYGTEDTSECYSKLTERPLTAWYLVNPGMNFPFTAELRATEESNVNMASNLMQAATDLMAVASVPSGNAAIIEKLSGAAVQSYAGKIDNTIAAHWKKTQVDALDLSLEIYPEQGANAAQHKDSIVFDVAGVIAGWSGTRIGNRRPAMVVYPEYRASLLKTGASYPATADILQTRVGLGKNESLEYILRNDLDGVSILNAMTYTTRAAIEPFCVNLKNMLSKYFDSDDALVLKHSILYEYTTFYDSREMYTRRCLTKKEQQRLNNLAGKFEKPDFSNLERQEYQDRFQKTAARLLPLVTALRRQDREAFIALSEDPAKFRLVADNGKIIGSHQNDMPLSLSGDAAIDTLLSRVIRGGCWTAPKEQSLQVLAFVALPQGQDPVGVLARFNQDGKLKALFFKDITEISLLLEIDDWPNENKCTLL